VAITRYVPELAGVKALERADGFCPLSGFVDVK
jgi:hypothetical protein